MKTLRKWPGCAVVLALLAGAGQPSTADELPEQLRDMKVFRFEFDNDTFVGSDDAFSAGWSVQVHSQFLDEWPPGLAGWIGRMPTLDDDGEGERIVRWSWGITQLIITPQDVAVAAAQPNDAPWAGLLGGHVAWTAYDNERLAALQLYLGCMGPCSQAEDAQKFVHDDLGFGEPPQGWQNQLEDEALFNLSYEYRRKIWSGGARYATSGLGHDLSVGAQAGVGGFADYAEAWLEYRFGWDIPRGFTKLADPPALGIALDPVYLDPSGPPSVQRSWRPYFNVVTRLRSVDDFAPLRGGSTQNGGYYRPVVTMPGDEQVIVGAHFAKIPLAFHITYYRYLDGEDLTDPLGTKTTLDWVNLSFERRF
jgi:hypothetical protein